MSPGILFQLKSFLENLEFIIYLFNYFHNKKYLKESANIIINITINSSIYFLIIHKFLKLVKLATNYINIRFIYSI